jgi:hypothetical protein
LELKRNKRMTKKNEEMGERMKGKEEWEKKKMEGKEYKWTNERKNEKINK